MHTGYGGGYFMGSMYWIWWVFWLALICGIVVFYGWGRANNRSYSLRETPHELLKRRLANGEISSDEYEQRKALLDRDTDVKK